MAKSKTTRALAASPWKNATTKPERHARRQGERWTARFRLPPEYGVDGQRLVETLEQQDWHVVRQTDRNIVLEHSAYRPTWGLRAVPRLQDELLIKSPSASKEEGLFLVVLAVAAAIVSWVALAHRAGWEALLFLCLGVAAIIRSAPAWDGEGQPSSPYTDYARLEFKVDNRGWLLLSDFPAVGAQDYSPVEDRLQDQLGEFAVVSDPNAKRLPVPAVDHDAATS